jgi:hypothetical protein
MILVVVMFAATLTMMNVRTSASNVRPVQPPAVHSRQVTVAAGQSVVLAPGLKVRLTPDQYCYRVPGSAGFGCRSVAELKSADRPLTVSLDTEDNPSPTTQMVVIGGYRGTDLADVLVHVPDGTTAATIVRLKGNPGWATYFVVLLERGNQYPTITASDAHGYVLDQIDVEPPQWTPPSAKVLRDSCLLHTTTVATANHPLPC